MELIDLQRLCELGPGRPSTQLRSQLSSLRPATLFSTPITDTEMADCCIAGLWLWHDFLDESHTISQGISTPSGSFWHGIMHRREPDFSNSKYWFRRVGEHPIFAQLSREATGLVAEERIPAQAQFLAAEGSWDAFRFVDLCQAAWSGANDLELICRRVARLEWQLLFDYCFHQATA